MVQVACIMMQKDEGELLRIWIEYHAQVFGFHNLYLYDNNSTDALTCRILRKYQDRGLSVNRMHPDVVAHTLKGSIFGDLIRSLDAFGEYDFFIPMDCDEFFVLRSGTTVTVEKTAIFAALMPLLAKPQALGIDISYYNILGQPDYFFAWPQRKTFFKRGTFLRMDSGFHEGQSRLAPGKLETRFAYIHYHHKPYNILFEHSKNKLRAFFDPDVPEQLHDPKHKNRLTDFITQGEASYMNKFKTDAGVYLPEFGNYLRKMGLSIPFS